MLAELHETITTRVYKFYVSMLVMRHCASI